MLFSVVGSSADEAGGGPEQCGQMVMFNQNVKPLLPSPTLSQNMCILIETTLSMLPE